MANEDRTPARPASANNPPPTSAERKTVHPRLRP